MTKTADYWVTVCSACLTASCWHGEWMCERARAAGTTERKASELHRANREYADSYGRENLRRITGAEPRAVSS